MDLRTLTVPVGKVRIMEVVFTCISFSLVASVGNYATISFWIWCMFTWCFCFIVTILILILEVTSTSAMLPISWDDFISAFAMLATLMILTASIIYPVFFACHRCAEQIAASVTSCLAFILYATEVGLTKAKPGEVSGFLSTVPGLLKVLEAFVACIIFINLDHSHYSRFPGLLWCVAVYSTCFIFALIVIIFTICQIKTLIPVPFDKVLIGCNILAVLMYITAMVIWPFYSFQNNSKPDVCPVFFCPWNHLVVITFMTSFNLVAYIVDTFYSFRLVFFVSRTTT